MDINFMDNDPPKPKNHHHQKKKCLLDESRHLYNIRFFNQTFVKIYGTTGIQ